MSDASDRLQGLIGLGEIMSDVIAAVGNHRASLEEAGFSPTAAEIGAMEFHKMMMQVLAQPTAPTKETT